MLPSILPGTYQRYKRDTSYFTRWLFETAVACGYYPNLSRSKAESAGVEQKNSAPKYVVTSQQLVEQARVVAKSRASSLSIPTIEPLKHAGHASNGTRAVLKVTRVMRVTLSFWKRFGRS